MTEVEVRPTLPISKRIRIIAEGLWAGKKIGDKHIPGTIAYECGVGQSTIYRDRQSKSFSDMYDTFAVEFMKQLAEISKITDENGKQTYLALAVSEKGRLIRAMTPRRIEAAIIQHVVVQPVFSSSLQSDPPKQVEAEYEEEE